MSIFKRIKKKINLLGKAHRCYLCGATFTRFLPYRGGLADLSPVLRQLKVIGSSVDNFGCPVCRSTDRERHLTMYFDALGLWEKIRGGRVLHFAPEHHLAKKFSSMSPEEYVRGDLYPTAPEIARIDITQIPFVDNYFDVVICNHVLEHVPDDARALAEIYRVLQPEGFAILQTPYSAVLFQTWEDGGVSAEQDRLLCFGQEDHVRLYGIDFFARVAAAGFCVDRKNHHEVLGSFNGDYFGVNDQEELVLARK